MGWELIILDILFRLQQDGSLTSGGPFRWAYKQQSRALQAPCQSESLLPMVTDINFLPMTSIPCQETRL